METTNQNVVSDKGIPNRMVGRAVGLSLIFFFFIGFHGLFVDNQSGGLSFLFYLLFIVIWMVSFRNERLFDGMIGGKDNKRQAWGALLIIQFLLAFPVLVKYDYNRAHLINTYIAISSILFAILFSVSVLYKNDNFKKAEFRGKNFIPVLIMFLGLVIGYGFSLAYNCSGILDYPKIYALNIESKYIHTGTSKGRIYHDPHFVVQSWEHGSSFGRDIEIPDVYFYRYPNISQIETRDSVNISVHLGTLHSSWMEVIQFVKAKNIEPPK